MSLPASPPWYGAVGSNAAWRAMLAPIKFGEEGWRAYAVQKVVGVAADGDWGAITDKAVAEWQGAHKDARGNPLVPDRVVGPTTQMSMLIAAAGAVDRATTAIPNRVLKGFVIFEGAGLLAATNWYTPPNGKPGCDCGPAQWRQYGPPFGLSGLLSSFDAKVALRHTSDSLASKMKEFDRARAAAGKAVLARPRVLELAVLNHNAPFLAWQFVNNNRLTTPNAEAVWTKKADGSHYTHAEWAVEYPRRILQFMA